MGRNVCIIIILGLIPETMHEGAPEVKLESSPMTFTVLVFELGFTWHRHNIGYMATFLLYLKRKTSGAPLCIVSGTNRHLSKATDNSKTYG
jgi:hypothetical protein